MDYITNLFVSCKSGLAIIWTGWISLILWAIGGFDLSLKVLLFLMFLDYATGLWIGYITATLNSKRAYKGINKKVIILVIICCSALMSKLIPNLGIRNLVIIFYVATEILSIVENASKLGVPIPAKLKKALEQCKGDVCNSYCHEPPTKKDINVDLDKEIK